MFSKHASIAFGLAAATLGIPSLSMAQTITQWNFNSATPDGSASTGTTLPNIGSGSITLLGGVTTTGFNSGVGSSDLSADNSGYQTTTYAAQGLGNLTTGVQFNLSTVGFENVAFSYDLRHSNTSSRYEQVQYTLDGLSFTNIALFDGNLGDTWFNGRTIDFSSISGADNNALFGVRVLSTFAPGTTTYAASNPTSVYSGGTWRFDNVTLSGAAVSPVPEPQSLALMLAGLAVVGGVVRRRSARRD